MRARARPPRGTGLGGRSPGSVGSGRDGLEEAGGDGRGDLAADAAALDHHGDRQVVAEADEPGVGRGLVAAATPGARATQKPKRDAACASTEPLSRWVASCTKAVLHDFANATLKGIEPSCSCSKLWMVMPPSLTSLGQVTLSPGCSPLASSAAVVTTLKVEPGG